MKYVELALRVGGTLFLLGGVFSFINKVFGWHIGYKGTEIPADLTVGGSFFIIGALMIGILILIMRRQRQRV